MTARRPLVLNADDAANPVIEELQTGDTLDGLPPAQSGQPAAALPPEGTVPELTGQSVTDPRLWSPVTLATYIKAGDEAVRQAMESLVATEIGKVPPLPPTAGLADLTGGSNTTPSIYPPTAIHDFVAGLIAHIPAPPSLPPAGSNAELTAGTEAALRQWSPSVIAQYVTAAISQIPATPASTAPTAGTAAELTAGTEAGTRVWAPAVLAAYVKAGAAATETSLRQRFDPMTGPKASAAELTAGTEAAIRALSPKLLHDYVTGQISQIPPPAAPGVPEVPTTGPSGPNWYVREDYNNGGTHTQNWLNVTAFLRAPGLVGHFAGQNPPAGWLKANGAKVSKTAYPDLFAVVGDTYGASDATTFVLPDLRGEFIRGWVDDGTVDAARAFGSKQDDAFRDHQHNVGTLVTGGTSFAVATNGSFNLANSLTSGATAGIGPETRPRNVALLACIRFL